MSATKRCLHKSSHASGQGLVEFALIMPLLILLMAGIIEFGRLLTIYNGVSNASREAARYGAVVGDANAAQAGTQYHFLDCAGMRAAARRTAVLSTLADSDIAIAYEKANTSGGFDPIGNCVQNTQPGSAIQNGYRVVVTVTTTYSPIVPLVPIPSRTFTFTAARTIFPNIVTIQCSDAQDNDADGQTDYPNDPGCATAADTDEGSANNSPVACYAITVNISPAGTGTYSTSPASDSKCTGVNAGKFSDFVVVTASPNAGYGFLNYTGDATGTNPAVTLTLNSAKTITANFGMACYTLTTSAIPAGDGSAAATTAPDCDSSDPDTDNDGFTVGSTVTIQASPACERALDYWSGDASGTSNPTSIIMDGNKSVTAHFRSAPSYTFEAFPANPGAGSTTPSSNDCPGGTYTADLPVTVSASPAANFIFDEWTSDPSGAPSSYVSDANPYTFTLTGPTTLYAQFDSVTCYQLQTNIVSNGGGTGGSVGATPANSAGCAAGSYTAGESVTLAAAAYTGYTFSPGWSGAGCSGTGACAFTMPAANTSVTATFTRSCYSLITAITPTTPASGGSVSYNPTNSATCSTGQYYYNETVTLTAAPTSGYYFSRWTNTNSDSANPTTVTMPAANKSVSLRFNTACVLEHNRRPLSAYVIALDYTNYTGSTKYFSKITVNWSGSNSEKMTLAQFGTDPSSWSTIWNGNETSLVTITGFSGNTGLFDAETKTLKLTFNFVISGTFVVTAWFDGVQVCDL